MFCPHCGSQQPDGAVFCGNCGQSMVGAPSAPQPAPVRQAPAPQQFAPQPAPVQQPFAQPAPAAHHVFGNAASSFQSTLTAATGFGKRSLAMLGGAVASFVCMFQPWIAMPWVDKTYDYVLNQPGLVFSQSDYGYAGLIQAYGSLCKAFPTSRLTCRGYLALAMLCAALFLKLTIFFRRPTWTIRPRSRRKVFWALLV